MKHGLAIRAFGHLVTRCTLYEQFTTEEAILNAAKTYGGISEYAYLDPQSTTY